MGYTTGQFIAFVRAKITDALNRQNTALRLRQVHERFATDYFNKASDTLEINQVNGLSTALSGAAPNAGAFTEIAAGQVGPHPGFTQQHPFNLYVLAAVVQGGIVPIPDAPTNGQVNDVGNTFQFTAVPAYVSRNDYEFEEPNRAGLVAFDNVNSYETGGSFYVQGLTGPIPIGLFRVRVKANGIRPAGNWLASAAVFTGTATPVGVKAAVPYFGVIDDVNNTVSLNSQYAFTEVRWGVEGQAPQALASNSVCSPGNIAGRLFAYVIADTSANRLQSDTVFTNTAFSAAASSGSAPTTTLSVVGGTSSVTAGQSVTLSGVATDPEGSGTVVKIEYFDNGVKLPAGETSGPSGALQTPPLAAGTHNFTAKATDASGLVGFSAAVVITSTATTTGHADLALLVVGNSTATNDYTPFSPTLIPQLQSKLAALGKTERFTTTANTAISGQNLQDMINGFATQVAGRFVAGKTNVLVIQELLNELSVQVNAGETGAAQRTYDKLKEFIALARGNNAAWKIITGTATPRTNAGTPQPAYENQRLVLNNLIRDGFAAGTLDVQAVARFGSDTRLTNPGPSTNATATATTYYKDWVHYSQQAVDVVVGPSFRDAIMFALYAIDQPAPLTGGNATGFLLAGNQDLAIISQTGGIAEVAPAGSRIFKVTGGGVYGDWSRDSVWSKKMPATGAAKVGFAVAAVDALNAIVGLTPTAILATGADVYNVYPVSYYQHEDGRVRYREATAGEYLVGPPVSIGDKLLFAKDGAALSLVKTTDGGTYTALVNFAGNYGVEQFVHVAFEASLGKLYGLQGFGLLEASGTTTPPAPVTVTRADSAALVTTGAWNKLPEDGGDAFTQIFGAFATLAFSGTRLRVFGKFGPALGVLRITLDNMAPVTVATAAATGAPNSFFYDFTGLAAGSHSVRFEKNIDDASYIVLNSFEVTG